MQPCLTIDKGWFGTKHAINQTKPIPLISYFQFQAMFGVVLGLLPNAATDNQVVRPLDWFFSFHEAESLHFLSSFRNLAYFQRCVYPFQTPKRVKAVFMELTAVFSIPSLKHLKHF